MQDLRLKMQNYVNYVRSTPRNAELCKISGS